MENKDAGGFHGCEFEGYLNWYGSHAGINRAFYLVLKVLVIISAAAIPILVNFPQLKLLTGSLGALIVVLEGVSKLFQFHNNWLNYRKTWHSLKLEEILYEAGVGDYGLMDTDKAALFVTRVASILSEEYSTWTEITEKISKGATPVTAKPAGLGKAE